MNGTPALTDTHAFLILQAAHNLTTHTCINFESSILIPIYQAKCMLLVKLVRYLIKIPD